MKLLWVLLTAGVTVAELLDKVYLPPRLASSGGSPGAIDVPLDLPKHIYNDKEFTNRSEIAIGINRIPSKVTDFEESRSKAIINDDALNIPTSSVFQDFSRVTPFPVASSQSTSMTGYYFDSNYLTHDFDEYATGGDISKSFPDFSIPAENNPQQILDDNKYPGVTVDDKHIQANLVYSGMIDIINSDPSKVSSLVNNDFSTPNKHYSSLVNSDVVTMATISQKLGNIPNSHSTSNYHSDHNGNLAVITHNSLMSFPTSSMTPITIHEESSLLNHFATEARPERIQSQFDRAAAILNYEQTRTPEGYAYSYDTSNGIHADESGTATNGVRAKGSYSYIGDDGKLYYVEYIADENGFQPKGAHLPTSPPIPDEILKVIEQVTKDKESGVYDDGSYNEEKYGHEKYQGVLKNHQKSASAHSTLFDMRTTSFPSRFSNIQYNSPEGLNSIEKTKEYENYNRTVPEPFLTPYVSRRNDDLESDESDDMTFENRYPINNKDSSTNSGYSRGENEQNNNSIKTDVVMQVFKLMLGKVPEQQLLFENRQLSSDNLIPSNEKGYNNNMLSFKQNDANLPLITAIGFPSGSTTYKTVDINAYDPEKIQSLSQKQGNEAKSYPVLNESQTSTEKILGEDFSGPEQRQSFDPVTGYHY